METTSKYKGVNFNKGTNLWMATICKNGTKKYLGLFEDEEEAAMAYDEEALELFGEYASVNFAHQ